MSKMSAQTPTDHMRKEIDRLVLALDRMDSGEWSRMANGIIDSLSPEDANALSHALIKKLYGDMMWQAVEFGVHANEFMDSAARRDDAATNATKVSGGCAADMVETATKLATRGWDVVKGVLAGGLTGGDNLDRILQRDPLADDEFRGDDEAKNGSTVPGS